MTRAARSAPIRPGIVGQVKQVDLNQFAGFTEIQPQGFFWTRLPKRGPFGSHLNAVARAFEQRFQIAERLRGEGKKGALTDERPDPRLPVDEPQRLQLALGFANRRAADAQHHDEGIFRREAAAFGIDPIPDPGGEQQVNLIYHRRRLFLDHL